MSTSSYTLDFLADEINKRLKTIPDLVLQKDLPSKLGDFYNNVGYITLNDIPSWAQKPTKPVYLASEVGAEAAGAVNTHNQDANAHADIRQLIKNLNGLDDTTLNDINNLVNAAKTEGITGKVNISDIVNDFDTTATDKPLSANQGKKLNDSYIALSGKYDILNGNYTALSGKYDILSGKYDILNDWASPLKKLLSTNGYNCDLQSQSQLVLKLKNSIGSRSYVSYNDNTGILGYIGFSQENTPAIMMSSGGNEYKIIHEGNIASHAATKTETWTFYLTDGTSITKKVYIEK